MTPNFALTLSFQGIGLLHRAADGWDVIGIVDMNAPDLAERLAELRKTALELSPDGMATKVVLPNEHILYTTLPEPVEGAAAVSRAMEGRTPYPSNALIFDHEISGGTTNVAAVTRLTLVEAETFAQQHDLNPVCFAAAAPEDHITREVFFGVTQALGSGFDIGPEPQPVPIPAGVSDAETRADHGPMADDANDGPAAEDAAEDDDGAEVVTIDDADDALRPGAADDTLPDAAPEASLPARIYDEAAAKPREASLHPALARALSASSGQLSDTDPVIDTDTLASDESTATDALPDAAPAPDRHSDATGSEGPAVTFRSRARALSEAQSGASGGDALPQVTFVSASRVVRAQPRADEAPAPAEPLRKKNGEPVFARRRPARTEPPLRPESPPADTAAPALGAADASPDASAEIKPAARGHGDGDKTDLKQAGDRTSRRIETALGKAGHSLKGAAPKKAQMPEALARAVNARGAVAGGDTADLQPTPERPTAPAPRRDIAKTTVPEDRTASIIAALKRARPGADAPLSQPERAESGLASFGSPDTGPARLRPPLPLGLFGAILGVLLVVMISAWAFFSDSGLSSLRGSGEAPATAVSAPEAPASEPPVPSAEPELRAIASSEVNPTEGGALRDPGQDAPATAAEPAATETNEAAEAPPAEAAPAAVGQILTPSEAQLIYAATGVWQRAPRLAFVPPTSEAVPSTSVALTAPQAQPTPAALPAAAALLSQDLAPAAVAPPPPPGATYELDPRGLVVATPEGVMTPSGAFVIAGRPEVIPAIRPGTEPAPVAEAAPAAPDAATAPDVAPQAAPNAAPDAAPDVAGAAAPELAPPAAAPLFATAPAAPPLRPGTPIPAPETAPEAAPAAETPATAASATAAPALARSDVIAPRARPGSESAAPAQPAPVAEPVPEAAPSVAPEAAPAPPADPTLRDTRPVLRPGSLVPLDTGPRPVTTPLPANPLPRGDILRPNTRPEGVAPDTRAEDTAAPEPSDSFATATALAVANAIEPRARPRGFGNVVDRAKAEQARIAKAVAAAASTQQAPRQAAAPAPSGGGTARQVSAAAARASGPTNSTVARQATQANAFNLRKTSLIGVFGSSRDRRALVRLANGRMMRVKVGDRLDGGRVVAIDTSSLRYQKGGRNVVLDMP